jgi:ATP-dependent helicase/DNAse subunit B
VRPAIRTYGPKESLMSSRKLDELATEIDDASMTVEELQSDPDTDADEKLEELHERLDKASDTIDDLEDND